MGVRLQYKSVPNSLRRGGLSGQVHFRPRAKEGSGGDLGERFIYQSLGAFSFLLSSPALSAVTPSHYHAKCYLSHRR